MSYWPGDAEETAAVAGGVAQVAARAMKAGRT